MMAQRAPIQVQYLRPPTTAFSNMNIWGTSHEIVDFRIRPEFGFPPDGETGPE